MAERKCLHETQPKQASDACSTHAAPMWVGAESAIPILFPQKQADEFFTADGPVRIYEALASPEKPLGMVRRTRAARTIE